jgi:hypothetical protein
MRWQLALLFGLGPMPLAAGPLAEPTTCTVPWPEGGDSNEVSYRVDADVIVPFVPFRVPLATRLGVAWANGRHSEAPDGAGGRVLRMEALSVSVPEKANGLEWTYYLREAWSVGSPRPWSRYLSVLAEPPQRAQPATATTPVARRAYVVCGASEAEAEESVSARLTLLASWRRSAEVPLVAEPALLAHPRRLRQTLLNTGAWSEPMGLFGALETSLHRVAPAVAAGRAIPGHRLPFVYGSHLYLLEFLDASRDSARGRDLAAARVSNRPQAVLKARYRYARDTGESIDFTVWIEAPAAPGAGLLVPLAFETQPRSYLVVRAELVAAGEDASATR